jgi:hypothetical protein
MRVGMIFECGQIGADGKVYPYLARKIRDDIEVVPVFLDSKPKLTELCGKVAKDLIEIDECEKILIIWDLRPPWEQKHKIKLCPVNDCLRIRATLEDALLTPQQRAKVHLLCVEQELETFLLVDEHAICDYLEKITGHPCKVQSVKNPERIANPKERLYDIFQQNNCRKYNDLKDAEKIVKLVNISKLQRNKAFVRFERTVRSL